MKGGKRYHSRDDVLGYNARNNIIVFERTGGKSFGYKDLCVQEFLNKGREFTYIRRTVGELEESLHNWGGDIQKNFDKEIRVKGDEIYVDGRIAGYGLCVKRAYRYKSKTLPNVFNHVYDEFIIDAGARYLPNEPNDFMSIIKSVSRDRQFRTFLIGNKTSTITPYNIAWNLPPFDHTQFLKRYNTLIYLGDKDKNKRGFADANAKTPFDECFGHTSYARFSNDNEVISFDETSFISKRPPSAKLKYNLVVGNDIIGCFYDNMEGNIYFDTHTDRTHPIMINFDLDNLAECQLLYNPQTNYAKAVKGLLSLGGVWYNDKRTKLIMRDVIKRL